MGIGEKGTWLFIGVAVLLFLSAWVLKTSNQSPESFSFAATPAGNADNSIQKTKVHALIQTHPFNEALQMADVVSEIIIVSNAGEIDEPSAKTIFTAKVTKKFKGDIFPEETINILQQGNSKVEFNDTPLFQSGEKFVLILKKAIGFTDNTYWILGGESGIYQVLDEGSVVKWAKVDEQLEGVEIEDDKQAENSIPEESQTKETQLLNKELFEQLIESELKG